MAADGKRRRGRPRGDNQRGRSASRRRRGTGALDKDYLEALDGVRDEVAQPPGVESGAEVPAGAEPTATSALGGRGRFGSQELAWMIVQAAEDGSEARLLELSLGGDTSVDLPAVEAALRQLYGIKAGLNVALLGQILGRAARAPASVIRGNFPIARATQTQESDEARVEFLFLAAPGDLTSLSFAELAVALQQDELQRVLEGDLLTQLVVPDQELARVPAAGAAGEDIFGKSLSADALEPPLRAGINVRTAGDKMVSEIYGYVCVEDSRRLSVLSPVWVSRDHMEAYFVQFPQAQAPPRPQSDWLLRLLELREVTSGIDEPALERLCRHDLPPAERTAVRVACAREPVPGQDARIDYTFDPAKRAGRVLEDGSIDLRDRNAAIGITAGQKLGDFVPRSAGEAGFDLAGKELPAADGADRTFTAGENVRIEEQGEEGQTFYAEVDGHVAIDGDTIHVRTVFDVRGDLDYEVGNIDVPGDVRISGSVKPGFQVKAGGSVTIGGAVELGSSIHARGDVVVSQGILGETTSVVALGDIETKLVQNSSAMAKGTITVGSYVFNARVRAGDQVVVKSGGGERGGSIVGGETIASKGIQARKLGSPSTDRTIVGIGANPEDGARLAQLEQAQNHVSSETMRLLRTLGADAADAEELKERIRRIPAARRERVLVIMRKLRELETRKTEIVDSRSAIQGQVDAGLAQARITVTDAVYTDVHFRFGDSTQIVREDLGPSVFMWSEGQIRFRPP